LFVLVYTDALARVVFGDQSADTRIIFTTRNPTWDQMLILYEIYIWGDIDAVVASPPTIMCEIFDYDDGVGVKLFFVIFKKH